MFRNFLLITIILAFALPAFAQDPKETVEYWKAPGAFGGLAKNKTQEAEQILKKCSDKNNLYFVVEEDSKEWNICCAIYAALLGRPLNDVKEMKKRDKKEFLENPELLELFK
ncbi:MAG: hypothetical protein K2N11_01895 [Mucispirillum sp.]|nr:hypothetical protein [Mucispirillum sp.]